MSMQGRKNLQARTKASIKSAKEEGVPIIANLFADEHLKHRAMKKKKKFPFNQMNDR